MKFRDLLEVKQKGVAFANTFKVYLPDAKKLAKNYGIKWDTDSKDLWLLTDNKEHVMSYNTSKGEIYTDFDEEQIIDMIKGN